jgi:hypothetical protein
MWQGILDGNWSRKSSCVEDLCKDHDIGSPSDDIVHEMKNLEGDFHRIETIFAESSAFLPDDPDQLTDILKREEETGTRWIKPLLRFFAVEHANIQVAENDGPIEVQRLLATLARGARFMRRFSKKAPQILVA